LPLKSGSHAGSRFRFPATSGTAAQCWHFLYLNGGSLREIAEELVISPATAARHVANILAKLGFTSRAQIAAWAPPADGGVIPRRTGR